MDIFNFNYAEVLSFYLTFFRFSMFFLAVPFFNSANIPPQVKAAISFVLTLTVWPSIPISEIYFPKHPLDIAVMFLSEALLSLIVGMSISFLFAAIQTGGQVIGNQMGFSMVNTIDPLSGASETVTAHFLYMVTVLVFLGANGHLILLRGFTESFSFIPPGTLLINADIVAAIFSLSNMLFTLSVKVAAPILCVVFLVDLALALIGRAAPQMQIMVLGFPIKILVGFYFLVYMFAIIASYVEDYIYKLPTLLLNLLNLASPL